MKILVLGSGGREHALSWKLRQSQLTEEIYCAPGNAGIGQEAECLPVDLSNPEEMLDLAKRLQAWSMCLRRRGWPLSGRHGRPRVLRAAKSLPNSLCIVEAFRPHVLRRRRNSTRPFRR